MGGLFILAAVESEGPPQCIDNPSASAGARIPDLLPIKTSCRPLVNKPGAQGIKALLTETLQPTQLLTGDGNIVGASESCPVAR